MLFGVARLKAQPHKQPVYLVYTAVFELSPEIADSLTVGERLTDARGKGNAGEILIERVIYYRRSTLEELGERYGVTRERVRQVQNKKWQLASRLISKYRTGYTERLVDLFLGLEGGELIGAIAYVGYKNKFLGDQLVQLVSTDETRSSLEFILHRMR